ncbi:MAG: SPFH domain-containing protein [Candidatus Vogelbacteria bacterium]|nr:SPFH domain-containing protein [Candidatus Vogelbacteria bacterium]
MPGLRWKFCILYKVEKFPFVQVPAGEIGVVIAQVGAPTPIGAKSAEYKPEFGNFCNLTNFVKLGGQKGIQRPVLNPGNFAIHPVGFLVITKSRVYGLPISPELKEKRLTAESFDLKPDQLGWTIIKPDQRKDGKVVDVVGIVNVLDGKPLNSGDIANRLGDYNDVQAMEKADKPSAEVIEVLLGNKNAVHNNYQDFQAFLNNGGKIGLQHDPLLYGAYALNPFLVKVELMPMLVVKQGEVAVIKAYVGLPTVDTSGEAFKHGSTVKPGHRGTWEIGLGTGKYPINPRCYEAEIVPTAILTLNWADATSKAHDLDSQLKQIDAKSMEGFEFLIDLQVQIHIPEKQAPKVISMVGTMQNLVNEVLQAAVGNHFRDKLQSMPAIKFIETRNKVQVEAFEYIREKLSEYNVETKGIYIQDVVLPKDLVEVRTSREIANQEIETYKKQTEAETGRVEMEKAKGTANMQEELARSQVGINISQNQADARKAQADGEATYLSKTGAAKAAEVEAVGLARAQAYEKQVLALGKTETAFLNALTVASENHLGVMPNILVIGGGNSGGSALEALAATLTDMVSKQTAANAAANKETQVITS